MNNQLLCTFGELKNYGESVDFIFDSCEVVFGKVYVLQNVEKLTEVFITFNVEANVNKEIFQKTILVHRKKQTNTLYTINALNQIVKNENGGQLNSSFQIDWKNYQNSLVLTSETGLRVIPTKLLKIVSK
jgi:hypothetical protein